MDTLDLFVTYKVNTLMLQFVQSEASTPHVKQDVGNTHPWLCPNIHGCILEAICMAWLDALGIRSASPSGV